MENDIKKLSETIIQLAAAHATGMEKLSESIDFLARSIQSLGTGNAISGGVGASEGVGAIEYLAGQIREGFGSVAESLSELADSPEKLRAI